METCPDRVPKEGRPRDRAQAEVDFFLQEFSFPFGFLCFWTLNSQTQNKSKWTRR